MQCWSRLLQQAPALMLACVQPAIVLALFAGLQQIVVLVLYFGTHICLIVQSSSSLAGALVLAVKARDPPVHAYILWLERTVAALTKVLVL